PAQERLSMVRCYRGMGIECLEHETALAHSGISLPLGQTVEWFRADGCSDSLLVVANDAREMPTAAVGVGIIASRALPGHRMYRIERFSGSGGQELSEKLLGKVVEVARRDF